MEKYYTIMLILDSDNLPIYDYNRFIWKQYMNSHSDILSIFIKYNPNIDTDLLYEKDKNTLYIKGVEKYECKSIFLKTVKAFKFCHENFEYKYIVRTNLSSFWNFSNLKKYLKQRQHGKYLMGWLVSNKNDCENPFISGTGIIIPNNLVPLIFDHKDTIYIMDDIEITEFYRKKNIKIMCARRKLHNFVCKFEFKNKKEIDNHLEKIKKQKIVYFRIKSSENRESNDAYCLQKLLHQIYELSL
jgi:hypothetical protein